MARMALRTGYRVSTEAIRKHTEDVAAAARFGALLEAAEQADRALRDAQTRATPEPELRKLALDLDAALTAAMRAAYAAERAAIGPRGYDDRIFRRKAKAKPEIRALTAEAERLLTLRENHRLNGIPPAPLRPAV